MPEYVVYDPQGRTMVMTGDAPPTPEAIEAAFASAMPESITQATPEAQPDVPLESNAEYGTSASETEGISDLLGGARGPALITAAQAAPYAGVGTGQLLRGAAKVVPLLGGAVGATVGGGLGAAMDIPLVIGAFGGASLGAQAGRAASEPIGEALSRGGESLIETFSREPVTEFTRQRAREAAEAAQQATTTAQELAARPPIRVPAGGAAPINLPLVPPPGPTPADVTQMLNRVNNPNFLEQDVVRWPRPGPSILRPDESVLGLAREYAGQQGLPQPTRLNQYPAPVGESEVARALRQREHIASRTGSPTTRLRTPPPAAQAAPGGTPAPSPTVSPSIDVSVPPEAIQTAQSAATKAQLRAEAAALRIGKPSMARMLVQGGLKGLNIAGMGLTVMDLINWLRENPDAFAPAPGADVQRIPPLLERPF